jgi:hypothetical protein
MGVITRKAKKTIFNFETPSKSSPLNKGITVDDDNPPPSYHVAWKEKEESEQTWDSESP